MEKLGMLTGPILEANLTALEPQLSRMQGNILRSHGREHSVHLFLRFKSGMQSQVSGLIRGIADAKDGIITSAWEQRAQGENKQQSPNSLFCSFFLSAAGYEYFDPKFLTGFSAEFRGGMQGAQERLDDSPEYWEDGYKAGFHAMILLANADLDALHIKAQEIIGRFASVIDYCIEEEGNVTKEDGKSFDHFGFVDNISQTLFFEKDVKAQQERGGDRIGGAPRLLRVLSSLKTPMVSSTARTFLHTGAILFFVRCNSTSMGFRATLTGWPPTCNYKIHREQKPSSWVGFATAPRLFCNLPQEGTTLYPTTLTFRMIPKG